MVPGVWTLVALYYLNGPVSAHFDHLIYLLLRHKKVVEVCGSCLSMLIYWVIISFRVEAFSS